MIDSDMTVREIAVQLPHSTRLFEKLKIDYCCGGNRTLTEASSVAGIDVSDVVKMLEQQSEQAPQSGFVEFQKLSLPKLITHIVDTHHVFTREEITRLEALTAKVIAAHGENHPELHQVGKLFEQLSADLNPHMFKEEQVLFPYILALEAAAQSNHSAPFAPFGTVKNPVRKMMMEHDTAGEILRELRTVTSDYAVPGDACISYRTLYGALAAFEKDLHQHIHLENNLLFPRAVNVEAQLVG
jgi:regulator of cell morphogenesis and NO signaling